MDNLTQSKPKSVERFWDRYINTLAKQRITEKSRRWYVKRVEQYIQCFPDERLHSHTQQHVSRFFTQIGREGKLSDWQFRQAVDAIRILFCSLLKSDFCRLVDWEYWSEASKQLTPRHATLAREAINELKNDDDLRDSPTKDIGQCFSDALTRMITEIRRRAYSIRTEQSYEQWVVRFFAYQPHEKLEDLSSADVKAFLDHLVIKRNVAASTQSQALNALLFFFNSALGKD